MAIAWYNFTGVLQESKVWICYESCGSTIKFVEDVERECGHVILLRKSEVAKSRSNIETIS